MQTLPLGPLEKNNSQNGLVIDCQKKSLPSKLRGLVAGSGAFVVAADVSSSRLAVGADVGDGSSITEVLVKPMCKRHPSR